MVFSKLITGMKEIKKAEKHPDKNRYLGEAIEVLMSQKEELDSQKAELERLRDMKTITFLD